MSRWPDAIYEATLAEIEARAGLTFEPHRRSEVEQHLDDAVETLGLDGPEALAERQPWPPEVFAAVMDALTVGETYFFREPDILSVVLHRLVEGLPVAPQSERRLRVWSAGCASGEEPYTMLMLAEEMGRFGALDVMGTDIAPRVLARARAGLYRPWSLRAVDAARRHRYFRPEDGRWRVGERFRRAVVFQHHNLAGDLIPAISRGLWAFDAIVCRNVFIYMQPATVSAVVRRLYHALAPGGWLVLGSSDPPLEEPDLFEVTQTEAGLLYRRPDAAGLELPAFDRPIQAPRPASGPSEPPPPDPRVRASRALDRGRFSEALSALADAEPGVDTEALRVRARANAEGTRAALDTADAALARYPLAPELHYLRALLLAEAGDYEGAVAAAKRVLYLDRRLVVAHYTLGDLLLRLGDSAGATRSFKNAKNLCARLSGATLLALAQGETAGDVRRAAAAQLRLLEGAEPSGRRSRE